MKAVEALGMLHTQADIAVFIGVSEAKMSQLVAEGVIQRGQVAHRSKAGGLDLMQEWAALA